jgi:uncharacterized repeat protein (TIGR01451 family)
MKPKNALTWLMMTMIGVIGLSLAWQEHSLTRLAFAHSLAPDVEAQAPSYANNSITGGIRNIREFLEHCPTNDPIYGQLRSDIKLRRNGSLVGEIPCTEPISQLPIAQYTDELIYLQTLRTIYYMDLGHSGHLPWTSGTLYDWMISKIGGINLSDTAGYSHCCTTIGGEKYIVIQTQDDFNRNFDRQWQGISGNLALVMHEVRHTDGFSHNSGCGIPNGCDATYDESNLSPYGIQWWLAKNWLYGDLYVGFSCNTTAAVNGIAYWHFSGANDQYRNRFTSNPPPLLTMPQSPGGVCPVDLMKSTWRANLLSPTAGQFVTFSTDLLNAGGAANGTVVTVTLPNQTTYVPGSATTSQGSVSENGPLIFTLGTMEYNSPITIVFVVMVNSGVTSPTALSGQLTITWNGGSSSMHYGVVANANLLYLPSVRR